MEKIGKFTVVILVGVINTILYAFILMVLWGWFVVPIFGLNPLNLIESLGMALIFSFMTYGMVKVDNDNQGDSLTVRLLTLLGERIGMCLIVLFEGWIITLFM